MSVTAKPYSQEELLLLIRKGDQATFSTLYDTYSAVIYCTISRSGLDNKGCEEIFQATMIKIWKNISNFDPSKLRFLAWMLLIARTTTDEALQLQKLNKNSQIQTITNNVINNKEVLTLIYFKGYSLNKAAEILNVSMEELKVKLKLEFDQLRS
ncbi:MAG: sigma factor [Bacteroidia bacterium]